MTSKAAPWSDRRGVAAIEFALVSPFVMGMIFAAVEAGQLLQIKGALDRAVAVAARYGAVHSTSSSSPDSAASLQTMAANQVTTLIGTGLGTPTVTASFANNSNTTGNTVTVTASMSWTPVVPMPLIPATTLTATATLPIMN